MTKTHHICLLFFFSRFIGSFKSRKPKSKRSKSARPSSMSRKWKSNRLSTRCSWNFKGTDRSCSRRRPWGRSADKLMRKALADKSRWSDRRLSMSTSSKHLSSSNNLISKSNMLSSSLHKSKLLTLIWFDKKLLNVEKLKDRHSLPVLAWWDSSWAASFRTPSS